MDQILELRAQRASIIDKMQTVLDKVEEQNRDFTAVEEENYSGLEKTLDNLDAQIGDDRRQYIGARSQQMKEIVNPSNLPNINSSTGEWRNFGEFMATLRHDPSDSRLQELRVQQMKDGTSGGFGIPQQFSDQFLQVNVADAVIRPRAMIIPAGDPPDAELIIPALDQSSNQNMFGGVTVAHGDESMTIVESTAAIREVKLKPKKIQGYMTSSNELLNNWSAASAIIPRQMRNAMTAQEDIDFLSGDGVNKALGLLNAPAAININRSVANQIAWADIYAMLARLRAVGGRPIWIASQTCLPQIIQLADASSRAIWVPSAVPGVPSLLYGHELIFNDRSPSLGNRGDLVLADLRAYAIKDGSGPLISVSEHFRFQNDEVAFRLTWHVDAQSWLTEAIPLEGSTSNTVSPFVILDTP